MTVEVTEVLFTIISDLHRSSKSEKTSWETEARGRFFFCVNSPLSVKPAERTNPVRIHSACLIGHL